MTLIFIFIKQDMWSSDEIWRCQVKNSKHHGSETEESIDSRIWDCYVICIAGFRRHLFSMYLIFKIQDTKDIEW